MEETELLDASFADILTNIKESKLPNPVWLPEASHKVHGCYKTLRSDIHLYKDKWLYVHYCERYAYHYYELALLFYELFDQYKINIETVKYLLDKCLSDLNFVAKLKYLSRGTELLRTNAKKLLETVNAIHKNLYNKAIGLGHHYSSRNEKTLRRILLGLGAVRNGYIDLDVTKSEVVKGIELLNLLFNIEEILTRDSDMGRMDKYDLSTQLGEVYEMCGQVKVSDYYKKGATGQLILGIKDLGADDDSEDKKEEVKRVLKTALIENKSNLNKIRLIIANSHMELNNFEAAYLEAKYMKYCMKYFLESCEEVLKDVVATKDSSQFREIITALKDMIYFKDILYIFQNDYYYLLLEHNNQLSGIRELDLMRKLVKMCWATILPCSGTARLEITFLKELLQYLCSVPNIRDVLSYLKVENFCLYSDEAQDFIQCVLTLPDNGVLNAEPLKTAAKKLESSTSFFLGRDISDALYKYVVFPQIRMSYIKGRNVIRVTGKVIIISEVLPDVLKLKTAAVEELHFAEADIVHVDVNLDVRDWSGVNLVVSAKKIWVHGKITWDVSDLDAVEHVAPAAHGKSPGENGHPGLPGQPGLSGGNVFISANTLVRSASWTIRSCGGRGSAGHPGGNGCDGRPGTGIHETDFKKQFPKLKHSSSLSNSPFIQTETYILEAVTNMKEDWRDVKRQDSHNSSWWQGHRYVRGETSDGCEIIFSFYYHPVIKYDEAFLLYRGSAGQAGGRNGKGGEGAAGGYAGNFHVQVEDGHSINIESRAGTCGANGCDGNVGQPGKNGWDMGYIFQDGPFSPNYVIYGGSESYKLSLQYHTNKDGDNYVYCPYRKAMDLSDRYVSMNATSNTQGVLQRTQQNVRAQEQQLRQAPVAPVHRKAISHELTEEYVKAQAVDSFGDINQMDAHYAKLERQAAEELAEQAEQESTETENIKVMRQIRYENNMRRSPTQRSEHELPPERKSSEEILEDILTAPANHQLWGHLQDAVIPLADLQNLHSVLCKHKPYLGDNFGDVYNTLLLKYKFASLEQLPKQIVWPVTYDGIKLENLDQCLTKGESPTEITNYNLGSLTDYIQNDDDLRRQNVIYYCNTLPLSALLYPLKFFIVENPEWDATNKTLAEDLKNSLDSLETKLHTFIKSFVVTSFSDNNFGGEVLKRKQKFEKDFNDKEKHNVLLSMFYNYVQMHGVASTCYRELLAVSFNACVQIYAVDSNNEMYMYHNHNPSASNVLYLLLQHDEYTEMTVVKSHLELLRDRKYKSETYTDILQYVKTFVHKKQFDDFLQDCQVPVNFDETLAVCAYCSMYSEQDLIKMTASYFPINDKADAILYLSKLKTSYVGSRDALCTIFHRLQTEGRYITVNELAYLVNVILKSLANDNNAFTEYLWILSTQSQCNWLKELFLVELEDLTKAKLTKHQNLKKNLYKIDQRYIVLLLCMKIGNKDDIVPLAGIEKCLEILGGMTVDSQHLEKLPLSKWQYALREQLLQHKLVALGNWHSNDLQRAVYYLTCLESAMGHDLIEKFFEIMNQKKAALTSEIVLNLLTHFHTQEWSFNNDILQKLSNCSPQKLKDFIISSAEGTDQDRSLKALLDIINTNAHTTKNITGTLQKYKHVLTNLEGKINGESGVEKWAKDFKTQFGKISGTSQKEQYLNDNIASILYAVVRAIELKRNFKLRTTQQLAVLLLISHPHSTLAQIATGEGKSLIVVAAAIIKALCGEKVDVITSSSVLATRDAAINADIYKLFGVGVWHNCSESLRERQDAYSTCPVIYGHISSFQRDYLLDTFYEKNVLGDRNFQNVIVDEVDSMFLDKGNNTLYLSHDIPGLDKLESVYLFIWKLINTSLERAVTEADIKKAILYEMYGTITRLDFQDFLDISIQQANVICNWLRKLGVIDDRNRCLQYLTQDTARSLPNHLQQYADKISFIIAKTIDRPKEINIPNSLYKFVDRNVDMWIKNAMVAFVMEEGRDYVVDVDRSVRKADLNPNIIIIDKGTGTDQGNSEWEHALHQFLQLKHGCKISPQSLKAVFISNVSYFKKYTKLFGLTGTLGSQIDRDLLTELYDVHFVNVPTAKPKKFTELEPAVAANLSALTLEIVNKSKEMLDARRSVLIVCETINEVDSLHKAFQHAGVHKCLVYKREHEDCEFAQGKQKLEPGRVIIATNLAGRGTDIKINDELNNHGGLHVIVAYFPANCRVEQQAFGRAARCGRNGSAQLIVAGSSTVLDKRKQRDDLELQRISDIKVFYDTSIKMEEELFEMFTKTYREVKNSSLPEGQLHVALQRLIDRWAFWLDDQKNIQQVNRLQLQSFLTQLKNESSDWRKWTDDPIQMTTLGLYYVGEKLHCTAIEIFNFVINCEPQFCEAAHYYKAAAIFGLIDFEKCPLTDTDALRRQEAVQELLKAKTLFEKHSESCNLAATYVDTLKTSKKNCFIQINAYKEQQQTLSKLYNVYIESIQDILGHSVSSDIFKTPEIDYATSEDIYQDLLREGVLRQPFINAFSQDDLKEIAMSYGLSAVYLEKQIKHLAGWYMEENTILKELKEHVDIPSAEALWKLLLEEKLIRNEIQFVVVDKSKLTKAEADLLVNLPQMQLNFDSNDNKHVFLKPCCDFNPQRCFLFDKTAFLTNVGAFQYRRFKRNKVTSCWKVAEYTNADYKKYLPKYDSLTVEDLSTDGISVAEAKNIIKLLTENQILKGDGTVYRLGVKYNKVDLPNLTPYVDTIKHILTANFAYRIALEMLQDELKDSKKPVVLKIPSKPHVDLMWDLINKNIIRPVTVQMFGKELEGKVSEVMEQYLPSYGIWDKVANIVSDVEADVFVAMDNLMETRKKRACLTKSVTNSLNRVASVLDSLQVPDYNLAPLRDQLDSFEIPPLQEFRTFTSNSLSFLLRLEEKKWTSAMKWNIFILVMIAVLEIVIGTCLLLFSAGLLGFAGNVLVSEGVSDLIYAVSAWKSGYFSWSQYREHKMYSVVMSVLTSGIAAWFTKGAMVSRFGAKLAQEGVSVAGAEVAQMTGMQLLKEVGPRAVGYEVGKYIFKKSCEGVVTGLVNVGVDHLVDEYLQKTCADIADSILVDVDEAVENDKELKQTLNEIYCALGPQEANEFVKYYTGKFFTMPVISGALVPGAQRLVDCALGAFGQVLRNTGSSKGAVLLANLNKVFTVTKFVTYVAELRQSTNKLLSDFNIEMKNELNNRCRVQASYNEEEVAQFVDSTVALWRRELSRNASILVSQNIVKPLLQMATQKILRFLYKQCKTMYGHLRNKLHRYQFRKKKEKLRKRLDEEPDMPDEVRANLIKEYHESLAKVCQKVRSPSLYADLVMENGPMDMVCLEAAVRALPGALEARGITARPVHVIVDGEDGIRQEYLTQGSGEPHVIHLQTRGNHFTNVNTDASVTPSTGYDCLYNAMLADYPELGAISGTEMRELVSQTIRTDPHMRDIVNRGFHAFTLRRQLRGGYEDLSFTSREIQEMLQDGRAGLSQRSVGERTRDGLHLSQLADHLRTPPHFQGDPINVVRREGNRNEYIFMDNRRVVVISALTDVNINVPVRVFDYNEELPRARQRQYVARTAGEAAESRIRDNRLSETHPCGRNPVRTHGRNKSLFGPKRRAFNSGASSFNRCRGLGTGYDLGRVVYRAKDKLGFIHGEATNSTCL